MVQRRFLLSIVGAALLSGCAAPPAQASAGQLVDVQIVDRARNDVLPEHRHRGNSYVAGRPGDRYAVRLSNRSGARVLVVLSIDGIKAVSGETAATGQTGYVLSPWESADITGWRKSDAEAAAFYFTALPDSYAARTDRPHNVGVIGVAAFRERVPPPRPYRAEPFGAAAPGKAADGAPAPAAAPSTMAQAEKLGTGHGEREYSPISRTAFERATSYPAEIVQVRYDSHANLVASGVISARRGAPDPFPGYVPDPRP